MYAVGSRINTPNGGGNVAKWNGSTWTNAWSFNGSFNSIAFVGTDVYIGGLLSSSTFNNIAKWNGTSWSGIGGVLGDSVSVNALATSGNRLLVGGNFDTAGGIGAKNIATYTNGIWAGFPGTGIDSVPAAIAVSGTDVYVSGNFTTAGPITANKIAKWNSLTKAWSALGSGVTGSNSPILAIAVAGDKVYAGGNFGSIGGITASNIAVWNGNNWSPLGTGVNGTVTVIKVVGEDIYVGGSFGTAGGMTANRIAKWNGTSWSGFNSAVIPNTVRAIESSGNNLYVGSDYTTLDNPNYLLKYDGTTWTPLANGITGGGVTSIAVSGSDVYISGGFTAVGGISAARLAKWNGSNWSALGSGIPGNNNILKITNLGTDIIATGIFTSVDGIAANNIAKWNGNAWSPLGLGLNNNASIIASFGGDLYVGGAFTTAGCNASPFFARWRESQWTGSSNTDWHTAANWSNGIIPAANAGVTISSNNATISSADVTLSSLIVSGENTLTLGAGRTLTVNGRLDLTNGSLNGTGSLVVNGDLNLNDGNITGLSAVTVNGNLYLGGGNISQIGSIAVTECRASAISGGGVDSFIDGILTRCVNSNGSYRFPVGSNGIYAGVELSNINGGGNFSVEPKSGAFSGAAAGLPANRLQRWWSITNSGVVQADATFKYVDSEIVGNEPRYKVFGINGGNAQLQTTTLNTVSNLANVTGINTFSAFTLADGPSTPQLLKGRVRTARGRGAESVVVTLTDQFGNVRYTQTNPFGYYRFKDVLTWENYTVRVNSKRYTFSSNSQFFEFPENATNVNFTSTNR